MKRILQENKIDKDVGIDAIYDTIDDLMLSGNFDQIDSILCDSKINDIDIMLAYLTVTLPAKDKLVYREEYRMRFIKLHGTELIKGL